MLVNFFFPYTISYYKICRKIFLKSQIWFHGRLLALRLTQIGLIGNIPEEISNLDSLYHLGLAHNQLSGIIPESICNLTNLDFNYETLHGTPFNSNALCPPYPECLTGGQEFTDENGIWDEGEPFFDCGLDGICPEDNDYISPDEDDTEGMV